MATTLESSFYRMSNDRRFRTGTPPDIVVRSTFDWDKQAVRIIKVDWKLINWDSVLLARGAVCSNCNKLLTKSCSMGSDRPEFYWPSFARPTDKNSWICPRYEKWVN